MQDLTYNKENLNRFGKDLKKVYKKAVLSLDGNNYQHLKKVIWTGRIFSILGYSFIWIGINPISIIGISLGLMTRWLVMHHISHGGYDKVPGIPKKYTSKYFAQGFRRSIDWFDWIEPKAWAYEHNHLHHYFTGEPIDPDIPEKNSEILRSFRLPLWINYIFIFVSSCTWKFTYYAANTLNGLSMKKSNTSRHQYEINLTNFWDLRKKIVRDFWFKCIAPYGIVHFLLLPFIFYPLGKEVMLAVLLNRIFAELLHNFHTFLIIVTNHAGSDIYRFDDHFSNKDEFYLRQVLGSVNFNGGTNTKDYFMMYLNYQIEHHLFPDLPMDTYREIAPEVEAICKRYNINYVKEPLLIRVIKLYQNMAGKNSMVNEGYTVSGVSA